jgi:hypothetical protein
MVSDDLRSWEKLSEPEQAYWRGAADAGLAEIHGGRTCSCGSTYEGPAVDCDVHGSPSKAYKAGERVAWQDAQHLLKSANADGYNEGLAAKRQHALTEIGHPVDRQALIEFLTTNTQAGQYAGAIGKMVDAVLTRFDVREKPQGSGRSCEW